ncbi:MAG: zinc ribbon domain-containing protein [Phycisphaerae bacterium]
MSAGPASVSGQAPAYRPRRLLSIGLLVLVLTVVGIVVGRSLTNERSVVSSGGSLPTHYQMACRACGQRFELEVEAFRRALATRENRTANRIPCPKCGEKDAAYRVESGMAGMGELSPAGQGSINPRFPGSSEESPNPPE